MRFFGNKMSRQKSPDDSKLVEMAMNLGQRLEIPKLDVSEVRWTNHIGGEDPMLVRSDRCYFVRHAIVLPARMMGKLDLEEWQPLMASSILYRKLSGFSRRAQLVIALPFIGGLLATGAAMYLLRAGWPIFPGTALLLGAAVLWNLLYNPIEKKWRLQADTEASVLTGKDLFLRVLEKIDNMRLDDVERLKTSWHPRTPSITERIDNLQGFPSGFRGIAQSIPC